MTLGSYLADWLVLHAQDVKPRTADSYADLINRLVSPALGAVDVDAITPDDLRHLIAGIVEAGHERTAELVYVLLHLALAPRCPAALVGVKRPKHRQRSPIPWSDEEMAVYIGACQNHKHGLCFCLAAMLGMRRGEICGLRWKDVNWTTNEISICNQRVRLANGQVIDCAPKSEAGFRVIPIPSALLPRFRAARGHPEGYVCPLTPSGLSHAHQHLVKALGLPPIGLHGLRHTFATSSAKHVGDIRSLQSILGHSSYSVTANIYLHPDREMKTRAIDGPVDSWYTVLHPNKAGFGQKCT